MKKFIRQIIYFSLVLLILNLVCYLFIYKVYLEDYYHIEKDCNTYLLADSHGKALGNLKNFGICNFSSDSDSYADMEIKLKYLITKFQIKNLLITVDDHTLSPYRDVNNNKDRSFYFKAEGGDYSGLLNLGYLKSYVVFLNPKYASIVKAYINSKIFNFLHGNNAERWDTSTEKQKTEISSHRFKQQFSFASSSKNLQKNLMNIIKLCKKKNINLIGLKFPISKNYYQEMGEKSFKADSLLEAYGYPVIDLKKLYLDKPQFFSDPDHLNNSGVKRFIPLLKNKAKLYLK